MFFLLAAILTSSCIIIGFKLFERFRIDNVTAITVNYLVASGLGFMLCPAGTIITSFYQQSWFVLSLLSGFLLAATFIVYALSAQRSGVAVTSVSGKMSVVIPVLLGLMWYNEPAGWGKILGIVLALAAFYLTFVRKGEKFIKGAYIFPLLLFVGNGINDGILKVAEQDYLQNDFIFFLATAFTVSLIIGTTVLAVRSVVRKQLPNLRSIIAGIALGLVNWYSTYFFLMGLHHFDVSYFVPLFNVSIVTTGALAGAVFFREKLRMINWIGIAIAMAAIVLMAF